MRHQKVKILSFFLAVFIAVASFPALKTNAATIASGSCGTGVTYTLDDSGKLTIQGSGEMSNYSQPSAVPWASYRSQIKSIVVTGSVTSIGARAFYSCSNVTSVSLSTNLRAIGTNAFQRCTSLTTISIPNGVTEIGRQAFEGCTKLTTVTMANSVTSIGASAFENCSKITNITLSNKLESLGEAAFKKCTALTSITLPNSLTTISDSAFNGCTNLATVNLPSTLLKIEASAFQKCTSLKSIDLPDGIITISDAFINCSSLTSFTIPSSVQYFGELTLSGTGVREVTYNGTHEQFLGINVLVNDEENMTMDDVFAKLNISVIFAGGTSVSITTQPKDFTGKVGTIATFSVKASGEGLTYKWYESTGNNDWVECSYTGYNTSTLKVDITCNKDGHMYGCEVVDAYGHSVTSNNATLTIDRVPLMINRQPADYAGLAGETATFSVAAQGDELTYQWQVLKDGEWNNCSKDWGGKTNSLSFEIKSSYDGNTYHCIIKDGYGNKVTSNEVTLSLQVPLTIVTQPTDYTGRLGSTATFTVEATGTGLQYQWQVFANGNWTNCSNSDGAATSTLSLEATADRNGTKYRCIISDSRLQSLESDVVTLTVIRPIEISAQPKDCSCQLGSTATFSVSATGSNISYQWQVYSNGNWINCSANDGANTSTLTLTATTARNGLKYHCVITDAYQSSLVSNEATLTVISPITISSQPTDYTGPVDEKAHFTVTANGKDLSYQWQYNKDGKWTNLSGSTAVTNDYSIKIKDSLDGRKYRCVITDADSNIITTDTVILHVDRPDVELEIKTQPKNYSGIIGDKAKFKVVAVGNGLTYQWQYYKNGDWVNLSGNSALTSEYSITIKEALDGRKYRCVITDANEVTVTSNSAKLSIERPYVELSITSQPKDYFGQLGEKAKFKVVAEGNGLTYQWQYNKNGQWINLSGSSAITAEYSITIKEALDGREYRCVITDEYNFSVTTNTVTLSVQRPYVELSIVRQPENYTGVVGEKATYSVIATGTDLSYQWQYKKDGQWVNLSGNAALTANYAITIKDSLNGRCYRCVITDSNGATATTHEVFLKVVPAPLAETSYGFQNEIDISNLGSISEPVAPANEVVIVEAENAVVEETEVINTEAVETEVILTENVETTESVEETEVFETVDEQVS